MSSASPCVIPYSTSNRSLHGVEERQRVSLHLFSPFLVGWSKVERQKILEDGVLPFWVSHRPLSLLQRPRRLFSSSHDIHLEWVDHTPKREMGAGPIHHFLFRPLKAESKEEGG